MNKEETSLDVKNAKATKIQRLFRSYSARKKGKDLILLHVRRTCIAQEMLETERNYVDHLTMLTSIFYKPMKLQGVLNEQEMDAIFMNVQDILRMHRRILEQLEYKLKRWGHQQTLGDIFTNAISDFSMYKTYALRYPDARKTYKRLNKESIVFRDFLKIALSSPMCLKYDFADFLITPIQRLPRYALLLAKMKNTTDILHPDFNYCRVAVNRLQLVLTYMNLSAARTRDNEITSDKVQEMFNKIPRRVCQQIEKSNLDNYLYEGPLEHVDNVTSKRTSLYGFLFKETLILAKHIKPGIFGRTKLRYRLTGYKFSSATSVRLTNYDILPRMKGIKNAFELMHTNPGHQSFILVAPSRSIRNEWVSKLNKKRRLDCHYSRLTRAMHISSEEPKNKTPSLVQNKCKKRTFEIITK